MCTSKEFGGKRCDQASRFHTAKASLRHKIRRQIRDGEDEKAIINQNRLDDLVAAQKIYGDHVELMDIPLDKPTQKLIGKLHDAGLDPIIIGGSVRDVFYGATPKDIDIEVYGDTIDNISKTLRNQGYQVDEVGKSFGVLKVGQSNGLDVDISVPRRDSLVGDGHRGFDVDMDASLSFDEASERRDFTMNAMGYSPIYGVSIDPHNGLQDLKDNKLRHVSEAFAEDPLRVMRAFQFGARYDMTMHPDTIELSQKLLPKAKELSSERMVIEWEKFYAKGQSAGKGLDVLKQTGWDQTVPHLERYNTASTALTTQKAMDASRKAKMPVEKRVEVISASLAAHMNEAERADFIRATVHGKSHQRAAIALASKYETDTVPKVLALSRHLDEKANVSLAEYALVRESHGEDMSALRTQAKELKVLDKSRPPLIMGRDILKLANQRPGPWVGEITKASITAQDNHEFSNRKEALRWLKAEMKKATGK